MKQIEGVRRKATGMLVELKGLEHVEMFKRFRNTDLLGRGKGCIVGRVK